MSKKKGVHTQLGLIGLYVGRRKGFRGHSSYTDFADVLLINSYDYQGYFFSDYALYVCPGTLMGTFRLALSIIFQQSSFCFYVVPHMYKCIRNVKDTYSWIASMGQLYTNPEALIMYYLFIWHCRFMVQQNMQHTGRPIISCTGAIAQKEGIAF